ncbi:MAG: polysaccharide deacetylase family protein [Saprospiraceae bacterium]|nr:polysaccharide deacetylase family protein [Saprospiraceae bacterium]
MMRFFPLIITGFLFLTGCTQQDLSEAGHTGIARWKDNKRAAISITYDDGTIHQFTVARPIMDSLGFKGTFYIITGKIRGSAQGKFIGRPVKDIIAETADAQTNADNFFERASAIGFTGSGEALAYHTNAGALYESGKIEEAYQLIDEGYLKLRSGEIPVSEHNPQYARTDSTTWEDYRSYAADGHEIASHTVTHPRLAVLDEVNMLYELEQSKADIAKFLGPASTFSAECPYGTEDERVMEYAHQIYPALRNRMPEPWLEEINRSSSMQPGASDREYVQWQRGPLTNIQMQTMKSWIDTCVSRDNLWLVLVFHGVDGIGWEPRTGEELREYFTYIKTKEEDVWVATFAEVTKYLRERKNTEINSELMGDRVRVVLTPKLDTSVYNIPLTLKTYLPGDWKKVSIRQAEHLISYKMNKDETGLYILYNVHPSSQEIYIESI